MERSLTKKYKRYRNGQARNKSKVGKSGASTSFAKKVLSKEGYENVVVNG